MKFKKITTYIKTYSKSDTIKYLKSLKEVEKVINRTEALFIFTKPIKPANIGVPIKGFHQYPYGSFKIKIYKKYFEKYEDAGAVLVPKLCIGISRCEGHVLNVKNFLAKLACAHYPDQYIYGIIKKSWKRKDGYNHLHVEPCGWEDDQTEHICWGNIADDMYDAKQANDWFWVSKMAIELVKDGHFEENEKLLSLCILLAMQSDYIQKNYTKKIYNEFIINMKKRIKSFLNKQRKEYNINLKSVNFIGELKWLSR